MSDRKHVGAYEIERLLVKGDMTELFLARSSGAGGSAKQVVVKRILPVLAEDPAFVERFLADARLTASLHHPNLVEVIDVGFDGESLFVAMERVAGADLAQLTAAAQRLGQRLSVGEGVMIVVGAAAGLHHAHERGVVHRDVSSSNVHVTLDGRVKVGEFGIEYVPTAQRRGEPADRHDDLLALGNLLRELTPERDGALDAIVAKALRREPEARFETAAALQRELEAWAREQKVSLSPLLLARRMRECFGDHGEALPIPPPWVADAFDPLAPTATDANALMTLAAGERGGAGDCHTFAKGDLIAARYRVIRFIAAGGMGEVYEASDRELGMPIAVKTLRAEIAPSASAQERFRREILTARRVAHSNVCRIFDLGVDVSGGRRTLFLTMELLDGETLAARLAMRGPLPLAEAAAILRDLCAALDAAHGAGVIHRDLKPSNVMLVSERGGEARDHGSGRSGGERAVITDFGLALHHEGENRAFGLLSGTPAYMAPEQVTGGHASTASDIYSLGIIAFELVTGSKPFAAASLPRDRTEEAAPAASTRRPDLPPAWDAAIARCLERDPARRPARAGELLAAIEGRPSHAPATRPRLRTVVGLMLAGALVVTGATALVVRSRPPENGPRTGAAAMKPAAATAYADGVRLRHRFELAAAKGKLEQAAALEPESAIVQADLALVLSDLDEHERATAIADKALSLARSLPRDERLRVEAQVDVVRYELSKAIEIYQSLWTLLPDDAELGIALADVQLMAGRSADVLEATKRLRAQKALADDARLDLLEAGAHQNLGHTPEALASARAAEQKARGAHAEVLRARALLQLTVPLARLGQLDEADTACEQANAVFVSLADRPWQARALTRKGFVLRVRSKQSDARETLLAALDLARKSRSPSVQADALRQLGAIAKSQSDTKQALVYMEEAVGLYRKLGNGVGLAAAQSDRAGALVDAGREAEAIEPYRESIELAKDLGLSSSEAIARQNLAWALFNTGDLVAGRREADESLRVYQTMNAPTDLVYALDTAGSLALMSGDHTRAEQLLGEAISQREALKLSPAVAWQNMSELRMNQHRFTEAVALAEKAAVQFKADGRTLGECFAREVLTRAELLAGNVANARAAIDRATELCGADRADAVDLTRGRVLTAERKYEEATALLVAAMQRAETAKQVTRHLDIDEALGENELAAGKTAEGVARLDRVIDDYASRGFVESARSTQWMKQQLLRRPPRASAKRSG